MDDRASDYGRRTGMEFAMCVRLVNHNSCGSDFVVLLKSVWSHDIVSSRMDRQRGFCNIGLSSRATDYSALRYSGFQ